MAAQPEVQENPNPPKIIPEELLFSWKAPSRPFKRRDKPFWTRAIVIGSLFGFIVFLVEGAMPVLMIIAVVFLFYVLSTVEPEEIEYGITNKGIKISGNLTPMEQLQRFWFSRRYSDEILIFEIPTIPGRIEVVIKSEDKDKIRKALSEYIPEEEVPPSNLDKAANWFSAKVSS